MSTDVGAERSRNLRKTREGKVLSSKMDKSIVVLVERRVPHPLYGKVIKKFKKLYVHDENNEAGAGDTVSIMETKPISRLKRWRLVEVISKSKQ